MNAQIKAEWIAALRSGEYPQDKGMLHGDIGYCCLGVLCDLHAKSTGGTWGDDYTYLGEQNGLPIEVQKWAGLDRTFPLVGDQSLAVLNDGVEGWDEEEECDVEYEPSLPFTEIADLIEQHL